MISIKAAPLHTEVYLMTFMSRRDIAIKILTSVCKSKRNFVGVNHPNSLSVFLAKSRHGNVADWRTLNTPRYFLSITIPVHHYL
jgi:hypothetical protein